MYHIRDVPVNSIGNGGGGEPNCRPSNGHRGLSPLPWVGRRITHFTANGAVSTRSTLSLTPYRSVIGRGLLERRALSGRASSVSARTADLWRLPTSLTRPG